MSKVHIFSNSEVNARYPETDTSEMAKLAKDSINKGYSIASVEDKSFSRCSDRDLINSTKSAIENKFSYQTIMIRNLVDMSEIFSKNRVIVAFSVH